MIKFGKEIFTENRRIGDMEYPCIRYGKVVCANCKSRWHSKDNWYCPFCEELTKQIVDHYFENPDKRLYVNKK